MRSKKILINNLLIIFSALLILSSCENKEDDITVSFEHPDTGQPFQIVNAYKLYNDYFEKATQDKQQKNIKELYQSIIIDPIYDQCFADGEYLHLVDLFLNNTQNDYTALKNLIQDIDQEHVSKVIKNALFTSSEYLLVQINTTVCVVPVVELKTPSNLVTVGSGKIMFFYTGHFNEDTLKTGIAHEYHHSVWTHKYFSSEGLTTFLDNIVFEGKAVAFEKLVHPDGSFFPVYPYYSLTHWEMIEPHSSVKDINRYIEIMFGGGDLPRFYGYSVGYKMVKSYLDKHPNLTPSEWLGVSSEEIYDEADFLSK
ncbi:Zn-dependent protease [Filobacillus milosensis]|uniref:Zn-dependent protease n=1 Tax=Filobacillus milosensis TaxID=94137 RepID=A0A4Y8IT37_9BACI|nr:DUF2268 domain-containing putative Zn-dependent protease [Filobacillus milosensis]TFB23871.1 Zn-dependent protease [Filobacillus milosensis]